MKTSNNEKTRTEDEQLVTIHISPCSDQLKVLANSLTNMAASMFDSNPSDFHIGGLSEREQVRVKVKPWSVANAARQLTNLCRSLDIWSGERKFKNSVQNLNPSGKQCW